ncbi:hypothetical protein ACHWWK_06310 [Klebsiella pneumoniae]
MSSAINTRGKPPFVHHHRDVARRIAEQRREHLANRQGHRALRQPEQGNQQAGGH